MLFIFSHRPRDLPHARCSPRSGPRGRTFHAAQDPAHLSTMWPRGDICRCSSVGRAPMRRYVAGSNPAVCVRCMLPHCGIMESKTATRGFPVRCMKAAGRSNLLFGWLRLNVKNNGCDRHTGAGLKSSVVIRRCCLCEEAEAVNGCGVVTAIERLGRRVGQAEQSAAPETV